MTKKYAYCSTVQRTFVQDHRYVLNLTLSCPPIVLLLVLSVTPFKIDQNKNKNHLIAKVPKLGNEMR